MPEKSTFSSRYLPLLLTGLISLVVGVSGGLMLDHLRAKQKGLEYEVTTSEVFAGETQNIAILAVGVYNPGQKEIEDLLCQITVEDATVVEHKVTGLPISTQSITSTETTFELKTPFLNPEEDLSIQILLSLDAHDFDAPEITVRAKGVVGKKRSALVEEEKPELPLLIGTAASTLLPLILFRIVRRWYPQLLFTKRHKDDQRDVLAYIYWINGFDEESVAVRSSARELSYWSESDFLTERCLATGDESTIRRGIKALEDLMSYASVADTSCLLIHFNIARMALAIDDLEKAKESIALARKGHHRVIEKRIQFNESLSNLVYPEG